MHCVRIFHFVLNSIPNDQTSLRTKCELHDIFFALYKNWNFLFVRVVIVVVAAVRFSECVWRCCCFLFRFSNCLLFATICLVSLTFSCTSVVVVCGKRKIYIFFLVCTAHLTSVLLLRSFTTVVVKSSHVDFWLDVIQRKKIHFFFFFPF